MQINYISILVASVLQFALGSLWYSPVIFGKLWMRIMETTHLPKEELQKIQKEMIPFYALQFLLTMITTSIFAIFIFISKTYNIGMSVSMIAIFVWLGFIMPTQIGTVLWGKTNKKFWLKQICVMVSYQLAAIIIASFVLMF